MGKWIAALLLLFTTPAFAAPEDDLAAVAKHLPSDVRIFIARKDECHHWAGEDSYDAARGQQIERAIARLKCETLDRDEARLKRRHAKNVAVRKALTLADSIYL